MVASLCHRPMEQTLYEPNGIAGLAQPASWQGGAGEAMFQARAALASDIDDPEELKYALQALEQEALVADGPASGAFEALRAELQLRLAALKADATAVLEELIEPVSPRPVPIVPIAVLPPGWRKLEPQQGRHISADAAVPTEHIMAASPAPEVTTFISAKDDSEDEEHDEGVAALETAIELATSLGVDTSLAEERVASHRGLISLRVTWGNNSRCCLLPVGVSFASLIMEVARRFELSAAGRGQFGAAGGSPPFKLSMHNGAEVFHLCDQASWEACLSRCGLHGKPGRMELRLEVPFMVTGRRVATPCTAGSGAPPAPSAWRKQMDSQTAAPAVTRTGCERRVVRGAPQKASLQRAGVAPVAGAPVRRTQTRPRCGPGVSTTGYSQAALHLEGHSAAAGAVRTRRRPPPAAPPRQA